MTFEQNLRLIAIGVGVIFIVLAALVAIFGDEAGGCFPVLLGFVGVVFMVYGFTGDTAALQRQVGL